jgi:hypothetical protein
MQYTTLINEFQGFQEFCQSARPPALPTQSQVSHTADEWIMEVGYCKLIAPPRQAKAHAIA